MVRDRIAGKSLQVCVQRPRMVLSMPDPNNPFECRDKAMLELMYSSGLRRAEIAKLDLYDLDLENGLVKVRGKGKKERLVPVGKTACQWNRRYLEEVRPGLVKNPSEHAFYLSKYGSYLLVAVVGMIAKKYVALAGLKGFTAHSFRHAFASHLLQRGCSILYIQEMLGHSEFNTTQIYTHLRKENLRNVMEQCHPEGKMRQKVN